MKVLLAWMLLVTAVCADARWRPSVLPYKKSLHLPWTRIPFPNCPFKVSLRDGNEYEVHNPYGYACAPGYGYKDYFNVYATVHFDRMTIEEASYEGSVP
jgi:hypothetical protein